MKHTDAYLSVLVGRYHRPAATMDKRAHEAADIRKIVAEPVVI